MALAFRALSEGSGTDSPATTTRPTGTAAGDFLFWIYTQDSASRNLTAPTGWDTPSGWTNPFTSSNHRASVFVRKATGDASDDISTAISGATAWIATMVAISGALDDTVANMMDANDDSTEDNATHTMPAVTPTMADTLTIAATSYDSGAHSPVTWSAGDERNDVGGTNGIGHSIATIAQSSGVALSLTATHDNASAEDGWNVAIIIKPAAGGAVTVVKDLIQAGFIPGAR